MKKLSNYLAAHNRLRCLVLLAIAAVSVTSCSKDFDDEYSDGFRLGRRYYIAEELSFQIDSIRDYRCPANAMCIWAGDVDLFFKIYYHRQRIDTMVHMYRFNENPFDIGGHRWKITEVNPYPGISDKPGRTRVKIEINRNNFTN
jgi:hypothetical protein